MSTPTSEGWFFEEEMYKVLMTIKDVFNLEILREIDITREYGNSCFGIDFLLRNNKNYVFIQCKWQNNKSNLDAISKFRCACSDIPIPSELKRLHLFVTKFPMTSTGIEALNKMENSFNIYDDSGNYVMYNVLMLMKKKIITFLSTGLEINEINEVIDNSKTISYNKKPSAKVTVVKIT